MNKASSASRCYADNAETVEKCLAFTAGYEAAWVDLLLWRCIQFKWQGTYRKRICFHCAVVLRYLSRCEILEPCAVVKVIRIPDLAF